MRKGYYFWLIILSISMIKAYAAYTHLSNQGIEGHVYRISGNQMPSPGIKPAKPVGISTTLYIYELTNLNQTVKQDHSPFYSSIQTKLIKHVESGKDGYFKVNLPAGRYSIFVKKDSLFFANLFDGNNNISPVTVIPNSITKIDIRVDYDASY
ncbi:MAG: hypothetical protein ACHQEM_00175 [Chitinophagales bacterium]